jgi:hypothetical protein
MSFTRQFGENAGGSLVLNGIEKASLVLWKNTWYNTLTA